MGIVAEKIDAMVVKAPSPDHQILATLHNRSKLSLKFRSPETYESYDEEGLEYQLGRLAGVLWARWQRAYTEVLESENMQVMTRSIATDEATREYLDGMFLVDVIGKSKDERIRAKTRGLREWKVRIEPGTVQQLDETEFIKGCLEAAANAQALYNQQNEQRKQELGL